MPAALDALSVGLYVLIDDFLGPRHRGPGRPPKLTDAELITLAVAQVLLAIPNDRQFLALARWRLGHLFARLIDQSGYNRRLRALAPQIGRCISYLAWVSPSFCDRIRLDPAPGDDPAGHDDGQDDSHGDDHGRGHDDGQENDEHGELSCSTEALVAGAVVHEADCVRRPPACTSRSSS